MQLPFHGVSRKTILTAHAIFEGATPEELAVRDDVAVKSIYQRLWRAGNRIGFRPVRTNRGRPSRNTAPTMREYRATLPIKTGVA